MFKWMALLATVLTWPLISFGAFVRLKGAGLACPDWPLCYGKILPPPGFEIALEVGHRFVATVLGVSIIALVFIAYRHARYHAYRTLTMVSLLLVIIQGILGGLTVLMRLWPPTVIFHLIGGNLLFGLLVYLTYWGFREEAHADSLPTLHRLSRFSKWQGGMLVLFFVMIFSGGWNSSTYSGYACEAFPGCHAESWLSFSATSFREEVAASVVPEELEGQFLPKYQHEWIHMLHRLIAVAGTVVLLVLSWRLLYQQEHPTYRKIAVSLWLLLLIEIVVGITNAIYRIPVPVSALHTAIAATIVGLLSYSFAKSIHEMSLNR